MRRAATRDVAWTRLGNPRGRGRAVASDTARSMAFWSSRTLPAGVALEGGQRCAQRRGAAVSCPRSARGKASDSIRTSSRRSRTGKLDGTHVESVEGIWRAPGGHLRGRSAVVPQRSARPRDRSRPPTPRTLRYWSARSSFACSGVGSRHSSRKGSSARCSNLPMRRSVGRGGARSWPNARHSVSGIGRLDPRRPSALGPLVGPRHKLLPFRARAAHTLPGSGTPARWCGKPGHQLAAPSGTRRERSSSSR